MKICYFGIYNPDFGRNKVYITGLKQNGVEIIECRDSSPGLLKYWRLWKKHRDIFKHGGYDAMIVGYPGHVVVPFAKIISKKPVILDALCTLFEGEVISRGRNNLNFLMRRRISLIDYLAVKFADKILVETDAQKDFFVKKFHLKLNKDGRHKVERIFTGVDEEIFYADPSAVKHSKFTVVFRGKFLPEAGVKHVIKAAEILEKDGIELLIIGNGFLEKEITGQLNASKSRNIRWIKEDLPFDELRRKMLECHVSLGQFENHPRLERTIPHKAFESLAMGLSYVTGRAGGISELLTDGKDCLMVNLADADDLAAKILRLKNDPELARNIAENGRGLYEEKLTSKKLARDIIQIIEESISLKR